jgi:hypothetical protein
MVPYYKSGPNLLGSFFELRCPCLGDDVMSWGLWTVARGLWTMSLVFLGVLLPLLI